MENINALMLHQQHTGRGRATGILSGSWGWRPPPVKMPLTKGPMWKHDDVIHKTGSILHKISQRHEKQRLSHGHKRHAEQIWWSSAVWCLRYVYGQTDRQTDTLATVRPSLYIETVTWLRFAADVAARSSDVIGWVHS